MAMNYAKKYEKKVAERFKRASVTDSGCGHDYDFTGVKEITIYSVNTAPMTNYTRSGSNRYGTPNDIGDTIQTMALDRDRSFTFVIDKGNNQEQFNIKQASACLKRQIDEVAIPEIDTYRLNAWVTGKGLSSAKAENDNKDFAGDFATKCNKTIGSIVSGATALTKSNILETLFLAHADMTDRDVSGKVTVYIPEKTYVLGKLNDVVIGGSQLNGEAVRKGYKGTIDDMEIMTVPSSRWPAAAANGKAPLFLMKTAGTTVDPFTLKEYKVHKDPPGINGDLVEGRMIYDSFVLDAHMEGILVVTANS